MASVTKIHYGGKGFWISEAFVEVLSQFICEVFETNRLINFSTNLQSVYQDCDRNRLGESIGMVGILFNKYIITSEDKSALTNVLEGAKRLVLAKGDELSISFLNQFEDNKSDEYFKDQWSTPIKTQSLAATIDIIIAMLNETWESDNYGVYYQGFGVPDGVTPL